jgi:tRNA uridine 5-carboxymethylaminomethyl modification enzyme
MFTSRAEYRLSLREDNADARLTPTGRELGVVDDERWSAFERKRAVVARESARLRSVVVQPARLTPPDRRILTADLARPTTALELLRRPDLGHAAVTKLSMVGRMQGDDHAPEFALQVATTLETEARYAGYIERQQREIARQAKQESLRMPDDLDYAGVRGLSHENRQRLAAARPATLGQASRLEGMTSSAVSLLLIHLKKRYLKKTA